VKVNRLFLDTAFVVALVNPRDPYHGRAQEWLKRLPTLREAWVTETVLTGVGNGLARSGRERAVSFIRSCHHTPNIRVVGLDTSLMHRALDLYADHHDKDWGLTDCQSFLVMRDQGLMDALTTDEHFVQAGFRALLLEEAPE